MCVSAGAVPVHTCPRLPFEPISRYFLAVWLSFQAGKNLVVLLFFLLLRRLKSDVKKKKRF